MNIGMQVIFFNFKFLCFYGYMPRSGIDGSYDKSIFIF